MTRCRQQVGVYGVGISQGGQGRFRALRAGLVLSALCLGLPALAQPSTCSTGPCVAVELVDDDDIVYANPEPLQRYLKHVEPGATTTIIARAIFTPPPYLLGPRCWVYNGGFQSCCHDPREAYWDVTGDGIDSHTIVSEQTWGDFFLAEIDLIASETGGEVTVTCTVGPLSQDAGCCPPGAVHRGDHSGAEGDVKFRLWHLDVDASESIVRATEGTFQGSVHGGVTVEKWDWVSYFSEDDPEDPETIPIATQEDGTSQWVGALVTATRVYCAVRVTNPYDANAAKEAEKGALTDVTPRPGWNTEVFYNGVVDSNWQSAEDAFPEKPGFRAYGQNTNTALAYRDANAIMVVPVYGDPQLFPDDYNIFPNRVEEVASGPNEGLWYTKSQAIYGVNRVVRFNHWAGSGAGRPTVPSQYNGNDYENWLEVQKVALGGECSCADPGHHGGTWNTTRELANLQHEMYGPSSGGTETSRRKLGHQALIEDVYDAPQQAEQADILARVEDNVARSLEGLRTKNEQDRAQVHSILYNATLDLHYPNLGSAPDRHNFWGQLVVWTNYGVPGGNWTWKTIPAPFAQWNLNGAY